MKKIKHLCKFLSITLLFLVSSVSIAFANNLKNNPVDNSNSTWGEQYLTGTTFSIANDDSETDKPYFLLSEVVFGRPLATIEMGQNYQEAMDAWSTGGSLSAPRFTILSNPALLESTYTEKSDNVNRLIFRAPQKGETVFKINVGPYKANTDFAFNFNIEELAGVGGSEYTVYVNGAQISNSVISVNSKKSKSISSYSSSLTDSQLLIELKRSGDSGDDAVLAISDLYIYGGTEMLSISVSETTVELGATVTLTAFSALDMPAEEIKWEKKLDNGDFESMSATGKIITDVPNVGQTCYRAVATDETGATVYSDEACVNAEYKCMTNSATHNLFIEDFGTLASETVRNSGSVDYINTSIYSFIDNCKPLKAEGTYAIMTNPKYAGYGDLGNDDNSCSPDVKNLWFRDLYDHTSNGQNNGEWGAMLMVNAANLQGQSEQLVYSRTVDMPCSNTNMIFSAWFANAANPERVSTQISMKFVVRDENGRIIDAATLQIDEIKPADGWVKGETSFNSGNNDKLTVEIYNCIEGGNGNDFMVDDISFSICTPQVSLVPEPSLDEMIIEGDVVNGPCYEAIKLNVQTSMVDAIFETPQYLWFIKGAGESDFIHLSNNNNQTSLNTAIAPYTQYYVAVTANEEDARNYLEGKLSLCSPVAISNTVTLLCTPNLEVTVTARQCEKVFLTGTIYDAPDGFNFWWEKSIDGETWTKMPGFDGKFSIEYILTESTYFRINSEMVASASTDLQEMKGVKLESSVELGYPGTEVTFTATTTNLHMEGVLYKWFNSVAGSDWSNIKNTLESELTHTITNPEEMIKVQAAGCDDIVTIRKVEFYTHHVTSECNDIILKPISIIGNDEVISYKWQRSYDGENWEDVPESAMKQIDYEATDGTIIEGCVKVRITQDTYFRLVGVDAYNELYSNPNQGVSFFKYDDNCQGMPWDDFDTIYQATVDSTYRECNNITLFAKLEKEIPFNWQKSTVDGVWEDLAENTSPATIAITEPTMFRIKTSQGFISDSTQVFDLMEITLSIDKESIIIGEEITITSTSTNIDSSEPIVWFENGNQLVDVEGDVYSAKPIIPTKYSVIQAGCPAEAVAVTEIAWPTVFTPMVVDGFNDDFVVGLEPNVALTIYDRYGNLVVETTNGWDGKDAKGNYAMPNVYFYVATLANGDVVKGNVELLNEKQ